MWWDGEHACGGVDNMHVGVGDMHVVGWETCKWGVGDMNVGDGEHA